MTTRTTVILSLALIAVALAAGPLLWDRLPAQMASHWNANDQVDGTLPKFWGILLIPLMSLGMLALFLVLPSIDPLKANIAKFRSSFNLFILLIIAFLLYLHGLTILWSLGFQGFRMSSAMLPFLGILILFVGYLLRQARRNFFIGIRTPWTLSSDFVWDKTHRLGSNLFMLAGLLTLFGAFLGGAAAIWLTLVPLVVFSLVLAVYSYLLYRQETKA
jgi:uncharacterized membrane protein